MKNSTPEQQKKGMDGWMKWMDKHKKSLVDGGAPLGKTKRVDAKGTSNTKNGVGGYSIVQAHRMMRPRSCSARTIRTCNDAGRMDRDRRDHADSGDVGPHATPESEGNIVGLFTRKPRTRSVVCLKGLNGR